MNRLGQILHSRHSLARHAQTMPQAVRRIGIFPGAFDPVHAGHIAFALQAIEAAQLDEVVFLPERQPRDKPGVAHYAHRVAMITKAIRPHPDMAVLEMVDRRFSVIRTLPQLQAVFAGAELVFLLGSDALLSVPQWPYYHRLLASFELVVGLRSQHSEAVIRAAIASWSVQPDTLAVLQSYAPHVSSSHIRRAIGHDIQVSGLLQSVQNYARREWLYVSPAIITAHQ